MTQASSRIVDEITTGATTVMPFLPPNVALAVTIATSLLNVVMKAQNDGTDITDEQLVQLFNADDTAKIADLIAQKNVGASSPAS